MPEMDCLEATMALRAGNGRVLEWDALVMRVTNDEAANRLIDPPMRAPWHLSLDKEFA